jgi:hypothetical protein
LQRNRSPSLLPIPAWPVHLTGWQALGWELLGPAHTPSGASAQPLIAPDSEASQATVASSAAFSDLALEPAAVQHQDAEPVAEVTDFQRMTKAQIVAHCSAVHGVELDGAQSRAELIEQAIALEHAVAGAAAVELADLALGDGLL